MFYEIYAVKDIVIGSFNAPFVVPNVEVAKRSFVESNRSCPHVKDLQLYKLGNFNLTSGEIVPEFSFVMGGEHEE